VKKVPIYVNLLKGFKNDRAGRKADSYATIIAKVNKAKKTAKAGIKTILILQCQNQTA
jgi:hypothetical protein